MKTSCIEFSMILDSRIIIPTSAGFQEHLALGTQNINSSFKHVQLQYDTIGFGSANYFKTHPHTATTISSPHQGVRAGYLQSAKHVSYIPAGLPPCFLRVNGGTWKIIQQVVSNPPFISHLGHLGEKNLLRGLTYHGYQVGIPIISSNIEWDLTNGPLSKLLELLDTQV